MWLSSQIGFLDNNGNRELVDSEELWLRCGVRNLRGSPKRRGTAQHHPLPAVHGSSGGCHPLSEDAAIELELERKPEGMPP